VLLVKRGSNLSVRIPGKVCSPRSTLLRGRYSGIRTLSIHSRRRLHHNLKSSTVRLHAYPHHPSCQQLAQPQGPPPHPMAVVYPLAQAHSNSPHDHPNQSNQPEQSGNPGPVSSPYLFHVYFIWKHMLVRYVVHRRHSRACFYDSLQHSNSF